MDSGPWGGAAKVLRVRLSYSKWNLLGFSSGWSLGALRPGYTSGRIWTGPELAGSPHLPAGLIPLSWCWYLLVWEEPYLVESGGHKVLLGACPCQPAILVVLVGLCALQEARDRAEPPCSHPPKSPRGQEGPGQGSLGTDWTGEASCHYKIDLSQGQRCTQRADPATRPRLSPLFLRELSGCLAYH